MRGSVSGSLWALILGGVGLGVASQISGPPVGPTPVELATDTTIAPAEAPEAEDSASIDDTQIADAGDDVAEEPPAQTPELPDLVDEAPTDVVIAPDRPVVPGATEGATPVVSAAGEPAPALPDISEEAEIADDAAAADDAAVVVAPSPEVPEAPSTPAQDTELALVETPVDDAGSARETATAGSGLTPAAQALLDEINQVDPPEAPIDDPIQIAVDEAPTLVEPAPSDPPVLPELADAPAADIVVDTQDPSAPAIEIATEDSGRPALEFITEEPPAQAKTTQPVVEAPVIAEIPASPSSVGVQPTDETAEPSSDDIAESDNLPATTTGVRVNRPGAEPPVQPEQEAAVVEEEETTDEMPAMMRYAAEFENPRKLPMLSFALIDDGSISDPASDIAKLGLPVTVILDPLAADAPDRMAALRAAGVEVGFQASLPDGATPSDVEIAMEAAFGTLPEVVTLFSDGRDGVQQNRAVTGQVLAVLAAEGRGLVIAQRGLGNALRNAAEAGVPAAEVTRDIDASAQSEAALGRSLDQAAFRARQTGVSVLIGTLNGFNLAALAAWAPGVDQDQLLLAPVTGVLRKTAAN